jgi:hypothetical protein
MSAPSTSPPAGDDEGRCIRVGLVVPPEAAVDGLDEELEAAVRERFPEHDWQLDVAADSLIDPPAGTIDLADAARHRLLEEDWDLTLVVTESPLRLGRKALPDFSSPTHRVGLVSLPALGAVNVRKRLRDTALELVCELVEADEHDEAGRPAFRELREVAERPGEFAPLYALRVLVSNARLLGGMIRANRPWQFALRLYRVLVTALATAVFALITGEVWELADALGTARLTVATVTALVVTALVTIFAHGLWERAPNRRVRQDVVLFNVATFVTVAAGILFLYVALFAVTVAITALFVAPSVLAGTLGHDATVWDFAELGWLVSSIATLGGALGAALETGTAVREAAYAAGDEDDDEEDAPPA